MGLLGCRLSRVAVIGLLALASAGEPTLAQKLLSEGVQDLASQIAASVAKEQKRRIAVLPFRELDGKATVLGAYLAEELVTHLFSLGDLEIVERTMLDKVLGELKLGQTGVIDPATAKEVGKVAGVDAVVTGTLTDLQSFVAVNCRLIDVPTGRVFGAAQTKIVKDDDVKKILGLPMPEVAPSGGTGSRELARPTDPRSGQPDGGTVPSQQVQGFQFELLGCRVSGASVACEALITALEQDRRLQILSTCEPPSRMVDDLANEIRSAPEGWLGSSKNACPVADLIAGVSIKARLLFEGVSSEARLARVIEISCLALSERKRFSVQFRNVPLVRP